MYCSFLADVFLRARAAKAYGRTNLMLSAYFLLLNTSGPCWLLLQRLRIVLHKETIKNYLQNHKKFLQSRISVLVLLLDNCDYRSHVTHVQTESRSTMLHTINHCINELPPLETNLPARDIWRPFSDKDFSRWIAATPAESEQFSTKSWDMFVQRPRNKPLRFMFAGTGSNVHRSEVLILTPMFDLQTLTYEDVEVVVQKFYKENMEGTDRTFAFVSGDQQVWIKLWFLRMTQPIKYNWMIPVPGEWHWTWHIVQGLFGHYTDSILLPFAKVLGFRTLDKSAKVFHYAEDLLEMVSIGISQWIEDEMAEVTAQEGCPEGFNVIDWMHHIKETNRNAYELAYACFYYFVPYWRTRSALKWNKKDNMKPLWHWWVHLFIARRKTNYVVLSLRFLWIMEAMHPDVKKLYDEYRVMSFSGDEGTGIAWDCYMEMVYCVCI